MESVRILALVEHVDRELDVLALVKYQLGLRHGIDLRVANFYTDAPLLLNAPAPHIVLLPFCYGSNETTIRDYFNAWPDTRFYNLAWEQILSSSGRTLKAPRDEKARTQVVHLAWSAEFVEHLAASGVPRDRIVLVGHWLLGLYGSKYRSYFQPREELARRFGLDSRKRWIFVPENYRWAFLSDERLQSMAKPGLSREALFDMRAFCHHTLTQLLTWCQRLATDEQVEVILRPRPATSLREFRRFVETQTSIAVPAFRLIKDLTVREWVLASDVTVSTYSTVLIEAALAAKQVVMVAPTPIPQSLRYEWCDFVEPVVSEQEFMDRSMSHGNDSSAPLREWATGQFFPETDPIETLTRVIAAFAREPFIAQPRTEPATMEMPRWMKLLTARLTPRMRHRVFAAGLPGYAFNASTHEKDVFGAAEVERRCEAWRRALPP